MWWKTKQQFNFPLTPAATWIKNELMKKNNKASIQNPSIHEKTLIEQIIERTNEHNLNNVTRTKAYQVFYMKHPEIHWAFLAHMVSRNGGWNMTDLKGDFLSRLLGDIERNSFFDFLERANWLIFHDAYPQLLLYEESLKRGSSLFYLLPLFNISTFIEPVWNYFWKYQDSFVLTAGLIINEQNYIETRLVQNSFYKNEVIGTLEFLLQDVLSLNHILFPYVFEGGVNLAGRTVHQFENLNERILIGKKLYTILFRNKDQLKKTIEWAASNPHTGSRKDYWPHLFNHVKEMAPGKILLPRLDSCQLRPGAPRIFSPRLEFAWKNKGHVSEDVGDWYHDWRILSYISDSDEVINRGIQSEYCATLEKLELAAAAKKVLSVLD